MALPKFYNQGDQDIYQSGEHYIPQEQYRLDYKAPLPMSETETVTQGFGIPYTNAFTGGGGGGSGGNAFGYGSAIEPVSYGQYGQPGYSGGLPGNVQQTGTGRNMMADIDPNYDPNAPDSQWMSSKEYLTGKRKELPWLASTALSAIPLAGNWIRGKIEDRMNDPRLGQGKYKIGGMDYNQKGLYDSLAAQGMLFEGPGGLKTSTGKNFAGPGYVENQLDIYNDFLGNEFKGMDEDQINAAIAAQKLNKKGQFKWRQMTEAKTIYDKNKALGEKDWSGEAKETITPAQQVQQNIQTYGNRDRPNEGMNAPGSGKGQSPTGGDVSGTPFAEGGRIGYRNGEFVDEDINIQGPNFDVNENVEMAEGPSPFEMRIQELVDEGLSWQEAYNIAAQEFSRAEGDESFSQEGIASIV